MRVGVTGSSGFLGSAIVEALEERGDEVVRFVRPATGYAPGTVVRWDPKAGEVDDGDLRRVGGFDAVVNLAGAGIADRRWTAERKRTVLTSRTESTDLLVRAISSTDTGTTILLSGSAIGFYGSRGAEPIDESALPGNDFLARVCIAWEAAASKLGERGAGVALLRTGIVMSTQGGALKKQLPLFRIGLGGELGSGHQWLSPISLMDEVRAVLWVIDHRSSGPINLTAPISITNADFTKELALQLHRPARFNVPAVALRLVLGAQLTEEAVLASQRVEPRALLESGFSFRHPDVAAILRATLST